MLGYVGPGLARFDCVWLGWCDYPEVNILYMRVSLKGDRVLFASAHTSTVLSSGHAL